MHSASLLFVQTRSYVVIYAYIGMYICSNIFECAILQLLQADAQWAHMYAYICIYGLTYIQQYICAHSVTLGGSEAVM